MGVTTPLLPDDHMPTETPVPAPSLLQNPRVMSVTELWKHLI